MKQYRRSWLEVIRFASLCAAIATVVGAARPAEPIARRVYVSVRDARGGLVSDLTPADFTLKEGGKERAIVTVEPATAPMQIAILVEESLGADQSVRNGAYAFIRRVLSTAKVGLFLVGRRSVALTPYTSELQQLVNGIDRFGLNRVTQDENLTEAVFEVVKGLEKTEAARRVIIAVAIENPQSSSLRPDQVLNELQKSGVLFYAVTLPGGRPASSVGNMADDSSRAQILGDGTAQTGGRRAQVMGTPGIPIALLEFADELLHQHVITYTLPDGVKPDSRFSVSIKRKGLSVRSPSRIPSA